MKAVYIYTEPGKKAEIKPYIEVVSERCNELGWEVPQVYCDGFENVNSPGLSQLLQEIEKGKIDDLMLFSLEAWAKEERHRFVPVVGKIIGLVDSMVIACSPGIGVLKGRKDFPKLEGLFWSGEYYSNLNSVSVKVGMSNSSKKTGRPSLLETDREFVRQVAMLYNQNLSTKGIAQRLGVSYHKVYRALKHCEKGGAE
jgi:DNA invertase Pin-like site-specific DNA recombinase